MANLSIPEIAKTIRVLHVDDDASLLEISELILKDQYSGFEIDHACCVDEGLSKLAIGNYDIVVSDYEMPQKNGLQFLKEIRQSKSQIPFILFTGKGREEVAIKALNLGADGYHNKQGSPETVYGELSHSIKLLVERNKTKIALREQDLRFTKLAAQTPGMLFQFLRRPNGTFCVPFTSDGIYNIFGCTPQEVRDDFSPIAKAIFPQDFEKVIQSIEQSATNLSLWQCEYRVQLPGQEIRWLWGQSVPERLADGSILWSGYNTDITELKNAEEKLRGTFEVLERVGEGIDAGLAIIGKDYRVVWANKRLMALGVSPNKKCYQTFNHSKTICQDCGAKKIFEQNSSLDVHEYKTVNAKGEAIWVELRVTPLKDKNGNVTAALELAVPITDRKQAEEALGISEARYRGLADSLPEIVFETDINGKLTYANQSAFEITGYRKEDLAKGICAFDLVEQKDKEKAIEHFRKTLEGKSSVKNEYTFIRKDGGTFPTIIVSNPFVVENKPVGLRGIAVNIAERKRFEENLKSEKQKLQNVIDCTMVGTWEWNVQTGETVINDKWAEIVGYTKEELEPVSIETWRKLAHPVDLAKSNELAQMHFEGKTEYYSFDSRMRHRDGSWIWVLDQGKVVEWTTDGKPLKMFGTHTDITQRKKAEQEFAAEQALVQEVANNTDALIFSVGKDYCYTSFNRSHAAVMKAIYGVDIQIGKSILDYITVSADREITKHNIGKALDGEKLRKETYSGDDQLSRNYFLISHNPIRDAKGNVTGVVVVSNDVTEHKKAEEELKKDQAKMEIMNEKLNVIGRLTRHDVGNKLMVMKSNIYLLKKQIGDNPKLAKNFEGIDSAINKWDEMFEFSRSYEKIGVEKPSEIDVAQCFSQAATLLPNLGTIKVVNDCQGLYVTADSLLKQLFYNLFDNSLKYGEKVTQIRLSYTKEADGVKLFYEDDGVGIPEANKPKLFHEGFTTGKSTGLGLFLIKKMVEVYGWIIAEEGDPGKGAKFILTIPMLDKSWKHIN